jgi:SAM-dependent methyltransferase
MPTSPVPVLDRLSSLADATRARILLLLERSELTVSELCQVVQLPQSTVSRHLRILSREGWLTVRAEGPSRHYRLSPSLDAGAGQLWSAVREELARTPAAGRDRTRARSVLEARAERSKVFFSSQAGRWDALRKDLFGARADLQLLPGLLVGSEVVGDLGCGTGHLARLLAPFSREVIALDRSPEMLRIAKERTCDLGNVEVREGNLEALPIADATLDVAILSLVLHFVVDPGRALAEVHRTLRPGGAVLILDMLAHQRADFREEMGHVWLGFSPEALGEWLAEAGFGATPTVTELPAEPGASGPLLFALRARRS